MNRRKIIITIIIFIIILTTFVIIRPLFNKDDKVKLNKDEYGNVITKSGAFIPDDEYQRILQYYKDFEIDEMTDHDVIKAWEYIDDNFYCQLENNVYAKMNKGICQEGDEYLYCLNRNSDGTFEYIKAVNGNCD